MSDLTSFKGPKLCFLSTVWIKGNPLRQELQQPFEYGQVSINKELRRQQQVLQLQRSGGIRCYGGSEQLSKS